MFSSMQSMKSRTGIVFTLLAICLLSSMVWSQSKNAIPKFDGTWVLNREKSTGLTGAFGKAEIRLIVSQDNKELIVEQKLFTRGREQPAPQMIYKLDGSENEIEVVRPLAGTSKLKARWVASSKTLELFSTITGQIDGTPATVTTKEYWQLSASGDSLKVNRVRHSPQGAQSFKLIFEKQ